MTSQKILLKIYKNFFVSVGTHRSFYPPPTPASLPDGGNKKVTTIYFKNKQYKQWILILNSHQNEARRAKS